jgi:integrase
MAAIFRLRLITAQRGGEVAAMEAREIDLAGGWWTIPGYKSKNGLAHRVPLMPMALKILGQQLPRTGELGYLFPAPRAKGQSPTSKFGLTKATERIRKRTGIKDFKAHDLRRTASSLMTGMGIPRLTVAKILNHVEPGVTAVYDDGLDRGDRPFGWREQGYFRVFEIFRLLRYLSATQSYPFPLTIKMIPDRS